MTTIPGLCTLVSALLHYFVLVFFGWTLAQAINLYHKLVTVLESSVRHFVLKTALFVWRKSNILFMNFRLILSILTFIILSSM